MHKYEMLAIIDEGAYGIVYKVRNKENNRTYAIKRFKDLTTNKAVERLINRQITMLKGLRSQYVVEMKEVFKKQTKRRFSQGRIYIVFEYMGRNLLKFIEEGSLKQPDILRISYWVLKALEFMHGKGVMHRDIKPENILLEDGKIKLCDFGFARPLSSDDKAPTDYVATRWYRSPQLLLAMNYGKPADMWALGCMICEMIDSRPLFAGENEIDQLYLIQKTLGPLSAEQDQCFATSKRFQGLSFPLFMEKDSIRERYSSKVGRRLINLIERCLKMDPKQRITSEQALALPLFENFRAKDTISEHQKHYNPTTIYNSHAIQQGLTNELGRNRGKSLVKLTKLQYLSTDLNYRKADTIRMVEMREKAVHAYSHKLLPIRRASKM